MPARKNTASRAKHTLHGWIAWMIAVANAVKMPTGVRDFREYARYTSAATAGTATTGFIVDGLVNLRSSRRCLKSLRALACCCVTGPKHGKASRSDRNVNASSALTTTSHADFRYQSISTFTHYSPVSVAPCLMLTSEPSKKLLHLVQTRIHSTRHRATHHKRSINDT